MSFLKSKPLLIAACTLTVVAGAWWFKAPNAASTAALEQAAAVQAVTKDHSQCGVRCKHHHPDAELVRQSFEKTGGDAITQRFPGTTMADFWKGHALRKPVLAREALVAKTGDKVALQLGGNQSVEGVLTGRKNRKDGAQVFGMNVPGTAFHLQYIEMTDGRVVGALRQPNHPVSYRLSGTVQEPVITAITVVDDYCSKWSDENGAVVQGLPPADRAATSQAPVTRVAKLDSNVDSENVIYLDFDGEDITGSGSGWGDINATASSFSAAQIAQIWDYVAEDFRSFDVNVTTDRAVFDATPVGQRMMVIFTPTDDAAPGAGGVAFLGSFYNGSDEPCWVFNGGVGSAALAASHEVGHTLDLIHDGRNSPSEEYYGGNGTWGPIMGAPYGAGVVHWSKGEYTSASNQEDDTAIIAQTLPLNFDLVGDDSFSAEALLPDVDGNFTVDGGIETQADLDVYSFDTSGGLVTINAIPSGPSNGVNGQNLNIRLRITDSGGGTIVDSNDQGSLPTSISSNLVGGSYFLIVEGAGEGTWATGGYGDYGSIGNFSITGNLPPPTPGDFDGDGLSDDEELALGTDPYDRDTDGDGLSDRQEVYPFSTVDGQFAFEAALADALNKGGNLTIIDSPQKLYRIKRGLLSTPLPSPIPNNYDPLVDLPQRLWLGGHDSLSDGRFQWVTPAGELNGTEIGSAVLGYVTPGSTSITNVVNIDALTSGRRLYGSGLPGPVTISSLDVPNRTITLSSAVNATLAQGVANVIIQNPGTGFLTAPNVTFNPAGATATTTVALGRITSITVNNPGSYTTTPAVAFAGTSGAGAAGSAVLTPASTLSRVISINVTNGGSGYTTPPQVVINGVGTGATAEASIDGGVVTAVTVLNPGLGYTAAPTVTFVGGGGINAAAVATIADPAMRLYSPATPNTYVRWAGGLLPGNRLNVPEAISVNSGTEFLWSATQATTSMGYLLERPVTNPKSKDTDADGIDDLVEFNDYGTNPTLADSDNDGLSDPDELFVHKTNPKVVDTDGDGLPDGQEINGLAGGFKSNPLIIDSDGDLVSDFEEINAVPPTNPLDATSYPSTSPTLAANGLHNTVINGTQQNVSIDQTYAPFGHRPDTDKSGDDGSVAIRDRNGAIIWVDKAGRSVVIPNSSLARTLYVSNTECIMYNNRYDGTYDARNSVSRVVIHRRAANGGLTSSPEILIAGTIVDTAPISPTTYGFTLVVGQAFDDGFAESTQRFQSGVTAQGLPIFDIENINYWDVCNYTMYRITWDAQLQVLGGTQIDIAPGAPNLGTTRVIASGSDGSFVFNRSIAQNFFRDLPNGGFFNVETASYWASFNLNSENIRRVSLRFQPEVENVGYLSNVRALLEFPIVTEATFPDANLNPIFEETGNYELQDMRQRPNGVMNLVNTFPLDLGDKLLPVTTYTRAGTVPYVYTIGASRSTVKLYRVDAALTRLGPVVNLPDQVLDDTAAIRSAWDASLLVKSEGPSGLLWLPSIVNTVTNRVEGLSPARSITASTAALPMFVNNLQAVAWMNSEAPVDLTNGAQVPFAEISHFQKGPGNSVILTPLTPAIQGRYVALPPLLTPDPETEGWYVTTFEKTDARSALVRNYRLGLTSSVDRDGDGLPDVAEIGLGTNPGNADSDTDGVRDGDEIYPFELVEGNFTWEQARVDAARRGGRLAVLSTQSMQDGLKAIRGSLMLGKSWWVGGHDSLVEGTYQWLDADGNKFGPNISSPTNWDTFQPNNNTDSDGMEVGATARQAWSMAPNTKLQGYVIEFQVTSPLVADSQLRGDIDGDGLTYAEEVAAGTSPFMADSDEDGLSDSQELYPFRYVNASFNWETARNAAKQDGGRLAVFDTLAKLNGAIRQLGNTFGGSQVWIGLNDINPLAPLGSNAEGVYWWVDANGNNLDPITQQRVGTPLGLFSYWGFGQPNNLNDADGVTMGDGFIWRTLPVNTTLGYLVEFPTSNPTNRDTDNDGLLDGDEINTYRTSPILVDTDGDGLSDFVEVNTHRTDPTRADTDGDGLTDGSEINGVNGFTSNPLVSDSDGDGIVDFEEVNAAPPSDPNSAQSYPTGASPVLGAQFSFPVKIADDRTVTIDQSYAQFGQRPTASKIGEDGSAVLRDANGVLIWVNRQGQPLVIPAPSVADALYVTNTEVVIWDNRFDMLTDALGNDPESLVTIYRRAEDGTLTASEQLTLIGAIVETPNVTPATYALNLLTYRRWDDGDESLLVTATEVANVDAADRMELSYYTLAFAGAPRRVILASPPISKFGAIGGARVMPTAIGYGSDGSIVFNYRAPAQNVYTSVQDLQNPPTGIQAAWMSNTGMISYLPNRTSVVGYVSNNRLIAYSPQTTTAAVRAADGTITTPEIINPPVIRDIRRSNSANTLTNASETTVSGEVMLPFSSYTRLGSPVYFYTTDIGNRSITLYNGDDAIRKRGNAVILPSNQLISDDAIYIRNPNDASLLLKPNATSSDVFWVRSNIGSNNSASTLLQPFALRGSSLSLPLFVSNSESVIWNNGLAAVGPLGVINPASISHLTWSGTMNTAVVRTLTPPIEGRYIVNTPQVVMDPETEGWYIHSLEKSDARSVVIRSYLLSSGMKVDTDRDGLPDSIEIANNTNPGSSDSDGDGLSDSDELSPYYVIEGSYTWQEAVRDATLRGGRLATFSNRDEYLAAVFRLSKQVRSLLWLGASDQLTEGLWTWNNSDGNLNSTTWVSAIAGALNWSGFYSQQGGLTIPWMPGAPNNFNNADALALRSDMFFEDRNPLERRGYVIEYIRSNPNVLDSDSDGLSDFREVREFGSNPGSLDGDGDAISDRLEVLGYRFSASRGLFILDQTINGYRTNPNLADTDGDGINDNLETSGYIWNGIAFVHDPSGYMSNPNVRDTDGDGYTDNFEVRISNPSSNPSNRNDRPIVLPDNDEDGEIVDEDERNKLNQLELIRQHDDIAIPQPFSPFGNRSDSNKHGDDGSSLIVDVNGMVLWKDHLNVLRVLPGSQYALPLLVSGSECLVWENALDPRRYSGDQGLRVRMYRIDATNGNAVPSPVIELEGEIILQTSPVTTRSQAYTLVTLSESGRGRIYRFTYLPIVNGTTGQPLNVQQTGEIPIITLDRDEIYGAQVRVLGHGSDGSMVFSIISRYDEDFHGQLSFDVDNWFAMFWVNGSSANQNSVWERIGLPLSDRLSFFRTDGTDAFSPFDQGIHPKVHYTSDRRILYQAPRFVTTTDVNNGQTISVDQHGEFLEAVRNINTGELSSDRSFLSWNNRSFLQRSTLTVEGKPNWLYELQGDQIIVWRNTNSIPVVEYRARVSPSGVINDTASIVKVNHDDGSAIVQTDSGNLGWIVNNNVVGRVEDETRNYIQLPNTSNSRPLFVNKNNLTVWGNAFDTVNSLGAMRPVELRYYSQFDAELTTGSSSGFANLSDRVNGGYILNTSPFTPDPDLWTFSTVEAMSNSTARLRTYKFTTILKLDTDADGIPDILELFSNNAPAGGANPSFLPDWDNDGLSDGDEDYPYYVIDGSYTWFEALADARARGGRLAVISNRHDYAAVVKRFSRIRTSSLWLSASDQQQEGAWNWMSGSQTTLYGFNQNTWQQIGNIISNDAPFINSPQISANLRVSRHSWDDFVSSPQELIPWAPGYPSDLADSDGLILRSDMRFEDRPLAERRGYLIEFPRTNSFQFDTDGDGLADGNEFTNGMNPTVSNPFAGVPTPPMYSPSGPFVNFAAPGVAGNYEGLVFDPKQGHTHRQVLSVNNRGAFSSSLTGLVAGIRGSFRGSFDPRGYTISAVPNTLGGMVSVELWMVEESSGQWIIRGRGLSNTGVTLGIELRRPKYSSGNRYSSPGRLTMMMPMADQTNEGPRGDAVAIGSINASGVVAMSMYHPDGGRSSFSGSILHGDLVALRSLSATRSAPSVVLGPLNMNDSAVDRDFGGMLRYYSPRAVPGSQFPGGFSQIRTVSGARYVAPVRGLMALSGFSTRQWNSLFSLEGGQLGGINQIGTWSSANTIAIPGSPAQTTTASYAVATGLLTYRTTVNNADQGLVNTTASGFAVHQQTASKNSPYSIVRGYYLSAFSNGSMNVTPYEGPPPALTMISPTTRRLFNGSGATQTYTIEVRTQGAWQVVVPAGLNWANVAVVGADAATPLAGNGNGTVTITVGANKTSAERVLRINIAGVTHTLTQDYRSHN